jgi:replicative DNA helicase
MKNSYQSDNGLAGVRLPPQNTDAETAVLGAILLDADAIIKVADDLQAEDFYDQRHQTIFDAIIQLFAKRQPIDVVTLKSRLEDENKLETIGGVSYLATLVNSVVTAAHVAEHAQLVRQKAVLRRLISASNEINRLGYQENEEVDSVLDRAEQALFAVSQKFLKQNFVNIRSVLTSTFERINELTENKGQTRGVPTGFKALDNLLSGFQKSDLIILAARPSVGKTSLALNFVERAASVHGKKVGVFSLEMSCDQLTDRLLCVVGDIDAWRLRTGNLTDADFSRLHEAMGKLAEVGIYIDDQAGLNVMEMRARARRLQMEHGLDMLVVDYLQLMSGGSGYSSTDNRVQEVSYISRSLKALARELDIPIIALSQLSRAVEQRSPKIPMLADLRESGSIEQDADVVMFIYRDEVYNKDTDKKNIAEIIVAKHRNGPIGSANLFFRADRTKFMDLDTSHLDDKAPVYVQPAEAAGGETPPPPGDSDAPSPF